MDETDDKAQTATHGHTAPPRKGWVRSIMDGITEQACAERGCYPEDWLTRQGQRPPSTGDKPR